jgi:serine/threonine protein kinase
MAELLGRKPLFPGKDYVDQLKLIIKTLGPPSEDDLTFINSHKARAYIRALQKSEVSQTAPSAAAARAVPTTRAAGPGAAPAPPDRTAQGPGAHQAEAPEAAARRAACGLGHASAHLPRPCRPPQPLEFSHKFPEADEMALDLMLRMLSFDPRKRITVEAALRHPWLQQLQDETQEPSALGG